MMKTKHRNEIYAYAISGILCAIVNLGSYQALLLCEMDYKAANAVSLILSKLSAYLLNKKFVFHTESSSAEQMLQEIIRFFAARFAVGIVEFVGVILLVEIFAFPSFPSKCFLIVLVVVLNYILSKIFVFRSV